VGARGKKIITKEVDGNNCVLFEGNTHIYFFCHEENFPYQDGLKSISYISMWSVAER
jgi:hypothetical protein